MLENKKGLSVLDTPKCTGNSSQLQSKDRCYDNTTLKGLTQGQRGLKIPLRNTETDKTH